MYIYKTTNLVNGKIYIGQSHYNDSKYLGSGLLILKAIKKYGRTNFRKDILVPNIHSKELMDKLEIAYINLYDARNHKVGYNIAIGGNNIMKGRKHSQVSINKMKESTKGCVPWNKGMTGGTIKENHRENIRKSLLGKRSRAAKLTDNEVLQIKYLLFNTILRQNKIADIYKVSKNTITAIKQGRTYSDIKVFVL